MHRILWRGGLPPLGCEAAPKLMVTAAQSNGGKPPRHKFITCHNGDVRAIKKAPRKAPFS
ncbi:hypothetical protein C9I49_08730 [Pseudomonas prosekii]|uniref:Uncharacterized protein n=1 Tax=Pseudomonas prosekii TaxID=1148509 RepID=A0A2U2DAC2_9PSED|nr:hypothetical protein C9I49_08730 [Pseudomonas prosekii]